MKRVIDLHPQVVDMRWRRSAARIEAGEGECSRRHRRLAAVVHGAALPQHFRWRARLSVASGMGKPAGYGKDAVQTIVASR